MPRRPKALPFTVKIDAGFNAEGVWIIIAELRFSDGTPPDGSDLLAQGRLAVLKGIAVAGADGRRLGAAQARVILDIDGSVQVIQPGAGAHTLH